MKLNSLQQNQTDGGTVIERRAQLWSPPAATAMCARARAFMAAHMRRFEVLFESNRPPSARA
jgi:hypothetical protein